MNLNLNRALLSVAHNFVFPFWQFRNGLRSIITRQSGDTCSPTKYGLFFSALFLGFCRRNRNYGVRYNETQNTMAAPGESAAAYEQVHVHEVYDAIADHFSATRYAPWPLVARFLAAQPSGSVGLDAGCGNGKYLTGVDDRDDGGDDDGAARFVLGCDRSAALAALAYDRHARARPGADVLLADSLALPFRDGCADFAICVAVVHHLSTRERRQEAVAELLRCVGGRRGGGGTDSATNSATNSAASPGSVLLYVWALEQAASRRGWSAGGEQDLLVPWVKTSRQKKKGEGDGNDKTTEPPPTFQRYYHLYREGELEEDVRAAGGRVVSSGYEKDNWWVIADGV